MREKIEREFKQKMEKEIQVKAQKAKEALM